MRRYALAVPLLALVVLAGCGPQRRMRFSQVAQLETPAREGVTYQQAFEVACGVMSDYFGRFEKIERGRGWIECEPTAYLPSRLEYTERRLPLSAAQARYRRTASMQIEARDGVILAGIRVEIQREDTRTHAQFARLRDPYDTEMDTPIEEGAEGAVEDRVWTFVRFDDQTEREALTDLADRLEQLAAAEEPPPVDAPQTPPAEPPN